MVNQGPAVKTKQDHIPKNSAEQADLVAQLNKEIESLSYAVSHDLRAPLRAINGYVEMLEEDHGASLSDEGKRLLSVITHNTSQMGKLLDNLLTFSRAGQKELHKSSIDMKEVTEGAIIDLNKVMANHAEIRIHRLPAISSDYALMNLVMVHLIGNAIKFSSKQEKPVIDIDAVTRGGEVIFSVKDNGVGFNMLYADKLFGVFQRMHTPEEFEGSGIGLAIVRRIINKHGGRVWPKSAPNEGATFYFTVPA